MQVKSYNSHNLIEKEQKNALMHRKLTATLYSLEIYDFLIIGSKHPITIFTDHEPILSLFARRGNKNPRVFTNHFFHTISKTWTQRQKFCSTDLLGRIFPTKLLKTHQKLHKTIPQSIEFHTANSKDLSNIDQTNYVIKDEPITSHDLINFYPVYFENGDDINILQKPDNGRKINVIPLTDNNTSLENLFAFEHRHKKTS